MKKNSITFIGAGNLAWHLAPALDNTDCAVREVYSRKRKHATELVSKLYEAEATDSLDFSESRSQIFILAVPDDAIEEVAGGMVIPDQTILLHTSGSRSIDILSHVSTNFGVLYPLQTFSKDKKIDFNDIPFFIEGNTKETEKALFALARSISKSVYPLSSDKRSKLHMAAVFASNFTNHMLSAAESIMKQNKLDFNWLKPLIAETLNKSLAIGPSRAQTGPAKRGDLEILDKHMEFLKKEKTLKEIYRLISQHILDNYH